MSFYVEVYPSDEAPEEPLRFDGVNSLALIDSNSHGPAALAVGGMEAGDKRLLICSTNTSAILVAKQ